MKATTKKEFKDAWKNEIKQIKKIGFSLDNIDDIERLFEIRDELEELVEKAAEQSTFKEEDN